MAAKKKEIIQINPIEDMETTIRLVGTTPLIVHKWDEKMMRMLPAGVQEWGDPDITKQ